MKRLFNTMLERKVRMLNCSGYNNHECNACLKAFESRLSLPNVSSLTLVLTLPGVYKRRGRMQKQLEGLALWPVQYVTEFEHKTIPNGCYGSCTTESFCRVGALNRAERSAYAIYFTNVVASRQALARGIRQLLVMEDDVLFSTHLMLEQFESMLSEMPSSWQYVAIGCSLYKDAVGTLRRGMSPCSRMYLLSRSGMARVATGMPMTRPIDYALPDIFSGSRDVFTLDTTPVRHGSHLHRRHRGVDF